MLHFNQVLHVEDQGFLYFCFDGIHSPEKKKYHVRVWTTGPQCHHFVMEERYGKWKIVRAPLPPQWILDLEMTLEQVIHQHRIYTMIPPSDFKLFRLPEYSLKTGS